MPRESRDPTYERGGGESGGTERATDGGALNGRGASAATGVTRCGAAGGTAACHKTLASAASGAWQTPVRAHASGEAAARCIGHAEPSEAGMSQWSAIGGAGASATTSWHGGAFTGADAS